MQIPRWNLLATRDLHVPYDANTCSKRLLTPRSFRYDCVCRSVHVIDTSNRSLATSRNLPTWLQWMIASCKTPSLPLYASVQSRGISMIKLVWSNLLWEQKIGTENFFSIRYREYELLQSLEVSTIYLNFYDYDNSHATFLFITFLIRIIC